MEAKKPDKNKKSVIKSVQVKVPLEVWEKSRHKLIKMDMTWQDLFMRSLERWLRD